MPRKSSDSTSDKPAGSKNGDSDRSKSLESWLWDAACKIRGAQGRGEVQGAHHSGHHRTEKSPHAQALHEGLRNESQKQTKIGPVSESWEVVRFEDSVSIENGQVDPRKAPFADMLHVGSENIESDTGRLVSLQTNAELKVSSGNYHFTSADVLYSKIRPYLNKVALSHFEGTCSADMYPLRSNTHFSREFLFYYLLSDGFKKAAISFQDSTGIPKINRMQLGSIGLACPEKEEQNEIAHRSRVVRRKAGRCSKETRVAKSPIPHPPS